MIKQLSQLFGVAAFLMVSGHPVQATTHQGVVLGGVNLTAWCAKQFGSGFKAKLVGETAGDWVCKNSAGDRKPISVKSACKLHYGNKAYKAKALDWNNPGSWKCLGKQAGPTCDPGPEEVSFFQDPNYKGVCSVLGIGKYANSKALDVRNDSISSIKVGYKVNVMVCKHGSGHKISAYNVFKDESDICQTLKKSTRNFNNHRIRNDSISSAMIFRLGGDPYNEKIRTFGRCRPKDLQVAVAVYENPNYKGTCERMDLGGYGSSKAMFIVRNDSISSIEFGKNSKARIIVCQHSGFKGRCETITESISDLYTSRIGEDQITSIRVERR